jgi:hypothetical protein
MTTNPLSFSSDRNVDVLCACDKIVGLGALIEAAKSGVL